MDSTQVRRPCVAERVSGDMSAVVRSVQHAAQRAIQDDAMLRAAETAFQAATLERGLCPQDTCGWIWVECSSCGVGSESTAEEAAVCSIAVHCATCDAKVNCCRCDLDEPS